MVGPLACKLLLFFLYGSRERGRELPKKEMASARLVTALMAHCANSPTAKGKCEKFSYLLGLGLIS